MSLRQTVQFCDIDLTEINCNFNKKRSDEADVEYKTDNGILIHSLSDLFQQITDLKQHCIKVYLTCSYFEIYNDQLYDLLDETPQRLLEPLQVCEDKVRNCSLIFQKKEFSVKGLIEVEVHSFQQCLDLLKLGE